MKSLKYSGMGNGAVNNFNIFSRFRYMNVFLPFELFSRIFTLCIIMAFLFSCRGHEKKIKGDTVDVESHNILTTNDIQIQDSTNILGDKLIFSEQIDKNGLISPDTIIVLESQNSNMSNGDFKTISTQGYFFRGKTTNYITFSKSETIANQHKNYYKTVIYRMRENNFSADTNLSKDRLSASYKNYDVTCIDEINCVYMIRPVKAYTHARMFLRLIKYNSKGFQQNSITINDFTLTDIISTKKGYMLGFNDFGTGSSAYFVDSHYSYKIVWLDNDLNVINTFHVEHPSTELKSLNSKNNGYSASFEMHLGCDMCDWNFCLFDLFFDGNYQLKNVKISKQPRDIKINPDTLLTEIQKYRIKSDAALTKKPIQ
jgi:hypothetical protein